MDISSLGKAALVIAHPGHELRIHGWLERARPICFVLTDGSGSKASSRLDATSNILERAGARAGSVYGWKTDRELYAAVLRGDHALYLNLAQTLADSLLQEKIDYVVGDACEGYNSGHDVCNLVRKAALTIATKHRRNYIPCYDFALAGPPQCASPKDAQGHLHIYLDEKALARKLAAARAYEELRGEMEAALARWGEASFALECLRPATALRPEDGLPDQTPFYEEFGQARVKEGHYHEILRRRQHILPLAEALYRHAQAG